MPRGKKRTIEDKIQAQQEIVDALAIRIRKEKDELDALYNEKKLQDVESLYSFILNAELSPDEAISILQTQVGTAEAQGAD